MTGQPGEAQHGHARPSAADMRASLRTARAVLLGDDPGARAAAGSGSCPACTALAGISFGVTLASELTGDTAFVSERSRRAMLAAIDAAERELRAAGN